MLAADEDGNTADTTLDPGDTWTYTCSYVIQWSQGDANPVVNTVTTCGMPPSGGPGGGQPGVRHRSALDDGRAPGHDDPAGDAGDGRRDGAVREPAAADRREPRPRAAGQREAARPERLPHHQRGGGDRDRAADREGDLLRDNKKVKTLTQPERKRWTWVLPMNVKRFAFGSHRVRATIQFARSSQTRARTLRLSFSRCHPANVTPKFTG